MPTPPTSKPIEPGDDAGPLSSRVRSHEPKLEERTQNESGPGFQSVFAAELSAIAKRREVVGLESSALDAALRAPEAPKPGAKLGLIGLSLSGGGIRSASFSLGVLQAFEHAKLTHHFDYLSTVSGGGFVGSTLSSALHHSQKDEIPFSLSTSPTSDGEIVKHLRNQSSYLTPGGFLETVRLPALVLRGLMLNLLALVPWLLGAALVTELYYALTYNNADTFRYIVDYVPMLVGFGPFVLLLITSPLVRWLERRRAAWRERYERAFAGSLIVAVIGVLTHFALLIVNFAIEHPDDAKRFLSSLATGWLALSGGLFLALLLVRAKNTPGARWLRRMVLAAAGALVPLALFSAYVFLSVHLSPAPYYQDEADRVSPELVNKLQSAADDPPNQELPAEVLRWLAQQGLEPSRHSFKHRSESEAETRARAWAQEAGIVDAGPRKAAHGRAEKCIDAVRACTSLERCDSCDVAVGVCDEASALCEAARACKGDCGAETRACAETLAACESARQCCWSAEDARTGEEFKISLWAHEETSLLDERGQVSLALYEIPLDSLALPKLTRQFEPLRELVARFDGERAAAPPGPRFESSILTRSDEGLDTESRIVLTGLALSMIALIVGWLSDANGLSLHGFYRDRIARSFVVRPRRGAPARFDSAPRLRISELTPETSGAPYPLLNATLNVSHGAESTVRFRRGRSFTFSPRFVGSPCTGYVPTRAMEKADPELTLASATAISAAAAGPNMGAFTSGWLAPLFALLNLRLGYWLPHPQRAENPSLLVRRPGIRHVLREGLGLIDDQGAFINVSDGGHFENLGAYELIRRKCRLIVVVDGEEDRRGELGGLTTLMRLVRIDFGAMITTDLDFFRDRQGGVERPWMWATINYGVLPDGREEIGYLLYIKATMVSGVPQYVQAYRAQNPDFPHESTADQFFDEVQFECYRALGCHIGGLVTQNRELLDQVTDLIESAPAPSKKILTSKA
jgi:hypothetical protein